MRSNVETNRGTPDSDVKVADASFSNTLSGVQHAAKPTSLELLQACCRHEVSVFCCSEIFKLKVLMLFTGTWIQANRDFVLLPFLA